MYFNHHNIRDLDTVTACGGRVTAVKAVRLSHLHKLTPEITNIGCQNVIFFNEE